MHNERRITLSAVHDGRQFRPLRQRLVGQARVVLPWVWRWGLAVLLLALVVPQLLSLQPPDLSSLDSPGWLVVALGAEALSVLCALVQQRCSVSLSTRQVGWRRLGKVTLAATAIGYVAPGGPTLAGVYCARRYRESGVEQEAAAAGQLLISMVTAVAAAAVGLAGVTVSSQGDFAGRVPPGAWAAVSWLSIALLGGGLLGLGLLRLPAGRRWIRSSRVLGRLVAAPRGGSGQQVTSGQRRPGVGPAHRPAVVALAVCSAVGVLVADWVSLLAALAAFGVHVTTAAAITAYAVVALVSLVPVTPGGLGIVEGGLFALLLVRGVPAGPLMAGVLTYRVVSYWLLVLVGGAAFVSERSRHPLTNGAGPPGEQADQSRADAGVPVGGHLHRGALRRRAARLSARAAITPVRPGVSSSSPSPL